MDSQNLHQLTQILGDHETLPIVRHVDFSSMKSSLDL